MAGLTYRTTAHTWVSKESPHTHTHTHGENKLEDRAVRLMLRVALLRSWVGWRLPSGGGMKNTPLPSHEGPVLSSCFYKQAVSPNSELKKQQNPNQNILFDTEKPWEKFLLRTEQNNSANLSVLKWGEMPPLTENSACGFKWVFNDAILKIGIRWRIVPHYWWHIFPSGFLVPKFQVFVALRANNTHKWRVKTSSRET